MCKYIDEVITYTGYQQHHRVTTRRFFNLYLARGLSMHCSSPEPSSVVVMGSTRERGACPVCSGARLEVEEVTSIQTSTLEGRCNHLDKRRLNNKAVRTAVEKMAIFHR